jgi:tRNA-specific 2-thiouridylase
VEHVRWLDAADDVGRPLECAVKTRYRQADLPCTVLPSAGHGASHERRVILRNPARAVTPGQYGVFYSGARCLGGGVIARRFNSHAPHATREFAYNSQFSMEGS